MKTQNTQLITYTAPKIKTVAVSTRTCILQGSVVNNFQQGSDSNNGGFGYDME